MMPVRTTSGQGPSAETTAATPDLKTLLNSCKQSSLPYTRISELREDCGYRIVKFERATTPFGETVMAVLEGLVGDDFFLRVYLPRRYNDVFTDRAIEQYNSGLGDRLHLVKRSAVAGSRFTPLDFV